MDHDSAETLTFLFTDLEGSTRLWERFPDAMKGALKRHDAILRSAIEAAGGRVIKSTGDGTMAVFPSAVQAVTASLDAQRDLAREAWHETGPLRVRMGLHAGLAEKRADDFFGPTVNRTARIMAAGHGGQVLLSASAASLAMERLPAGGSLLDLGEHRLKDLGRAEHVFQLVHPDLAADFGPLATASPQTNLPARAATFVGRQTDLKRIRERLDNSSVRLLTLVGPGGTGKTTLAIRTAEELAPHFPDGVSFVDLSSARDTNGVLTSIARALDVGEVVDRPLQDQITQRLRDRHTLLVLDNFEQVTEAAGFVASLLADCPKLKVLATSREALRLRAEHVHPVEPMSLPPAGTKQASAQQVEGCEAVQLFVDRAQAIRPNFQLTDDNAAVVAEICRRLDGLPLAIELAAARLRLLSPEALLHQLQNRLKLLRSGSRDLPERQQTLRAAMDWSYELLKPEEQRLFELLAVFSDADIADVEAVAAGLDVVAGPALDVFDGLASLIEKSLVRRVDVDGNEPRVAMLETIREFATDRLKQRTDFDADARKTHATYYADFARRLHADLASRRRAEALSAMAAEVGNLRIAWGYWVAEGDLEELDKLAESLLSLNDARSWYLDTVSLTTDMLSVLSRHSSSPDRLSQEISLRTSLARALLATKGFTPEVEEAFASVVELFERGGTDVRQHFSVLRGLLSLYQFRGQIDKSAHLGAEIVALGEREKNPRILIDGHLALGVSKMFVNDLEGGLRHLESAIALFGAAPSQAFGRRVANDPRIACLTTAGLTLWLLGFPDRAVGRANDALALSAELDHPFSSAYARFHSGLLHLWRRESEIVLDRAVGLLEVAEHYDLKIWSAVGACLKGAAQTGLGRFEEGLADIRRGMGLYQGLRSPPIFWGLLLSISAGAFHAAGRAAEALGPIDEAIKMMSPGEGSTVLPEFFILKGDVLTSLGTDGVRDVSQARYWYQLAYDCAAALGARMSQLRAATKLYRVERTAADQKAAADRLRSVYATFTEGFATADVTEARNILEADLKMQSTAS